MKMLKKCKKLDLKNKRPGVAILDLSDLPLIPNHRMSAIKKGTRLFLQIGLKKISSF
jgi:hypothetical protein